MNFYVDGSDKSKVRPELFCEDAEAVAKRLGNSQTKSNGRGRTKTINNKYTQVRKFYNQILAHKAKCDLDVDAINQELPYIKMLASKANYTYARENVTEVFLDFITSGVKKIEDKRDLDIFCNYFEAILGYAKTHIKSK